MSTTKEPSGGPEGECYNEKDYGTVGSGSLTSDSL
jgi:hypothetical protein